MEQDFPYKSLHDYLDDLFRDKTPTESEITQAKKQYWKTYNTRLKKSQRQKRREVTIAFEKDEWESLLKKRSPNQSLHAYIRELLIHPTDNNHISPSIPLQDTTQIEQQLFLVTDYLEGLMYQRRLMDKESVARLENLLAALQRLLEEKF